MTSTSKYENDKIVNIPRNLLLTIPQNIIIDLFTPFNARTAASKKQKSQKAIKEVRQGRKDDWSRKVGNLETEGEAITGDDVIVKSGEFKNV